MTARLEILPARGRLLVSTDLHGNLGDFDRLRRIFLELRAEAEDPSAVHWALLGDLVHGPSDHGREFDPLRFGYADESPALVEAVIELRARFPEAIHLVLGNHDHGHIGGPHTRKFHNDEVAALEARMDAGAKARMQALFRSARLALVAPCGLLLCHGSPDATLRSLDELDELDPERDVRSDADPRRHAILRSILTSYGQRGEVTAALLQQISTPALDLRVVVHGHDVDFGGWYTEHGNQACPVLFGAAPEQRRYLVVDLGAHYPRAEALREGFEVRHLYPGLDERE